MTDPERDSLLRLSKMDHACRYAWPGYTGLEKRGYAEALTDAAGDLVGYRITHDGSRMVQQILTAERAKE